MENFIFCSEWMFSVLFFASPQFFAFKVHLQTQQKASKGLISLGIDVVKNDGIIGLYSGISASILRQVSCYVMEKWS